MAARNLTRRRARKRLVWSPQPGPQTALLRCPIQEIFYGGARGGGKTDGVLGHWWRHAITYRNLARGIVFRTEYTQLLAIRERAKMLFEPYGAEWYEKEQALIFPNAAQLRFRHCRTADDASKYQGWEVNWLCLEELGEWPDPQAADKLYAILRDSQYVPTWFLATGNPGGRGHGWVRDTWIDQAPPLTPFQGVDYEGQPLTEDGTETGVPVKRIFIPARVFDNPILMNSDKKYMSMLRRQPKHLARAWIYGDWHVAPGAYLDGVWDPEVHIVEPFPGNEPPPWWKRWKACDWGFNDPCSIGWFTQRPDDGAIIHYREYYAHTRPNVGGRRTASEIAKTIHLMESAEPKGARRVPNVADHDLFGERGAHRGVTPATVFQKAGVTWHKAPKGPGSRVVGAGLIVDRLRSRKFFVTRNCRHWLRTVPILQPDPDNHEDVDTKAEDHCWDMTRYGLWAWASQTHPGVAPAPKRGNRNPEPRALTEEPQVDEERLILRPEEWDVHTWLQSLRTEEELDS